MTAIARPLFILLLVVGSILISATVDQLPPQLASHFGANGVASGWMNRHAYLLFTLALGIGLPLVVVLGMGVLPRLMPGSINLPNRDHWLAPARREATLSYLGAHACLLGCLLVAFIVAIHFLLIEANAAQPPQLPLRPFVLLMAAFLAGMAVWAVTLTRHFRRPR